MITSHFLQDSGQCIDPVLYESWTGAALNGSFQLLSGFEALSLLPGKAVNYGFVSQEELPESAPAYRGRNSCVCFAAGSSSLKQPSYTANVPLVRSFLPRARSSATCIHTWHMIKKHGSSNAILDSVLTAKYSAMHLLAQHMYCHLCQKLMGLDCLQDCFRDTGCSDVPQ